MDNVSDICPNTIKADQNTLDMTSPRQDGHRFLRSTTYHDKSWDGRCLKCGLQARIKNGEILDWPQGYKKPGSESSGSVRPKADKEK